MSCRFKVAHYALSLALFLVTPAAGQDVPVMTPIPDDNSVRPQIIGGKPANKKDWPLTLVFRSAAGGCTSTIIGQKVIVTAAHCVDHKSRAHAVLANKLIGLTCYHHRKYRGSTCNRAWKAEDIVGCTADIALCVADKALPTSVGKFELIKTSLPGPAKESKITLLGYGCTVAGGSMSPDLQIGEAVVEWASTPGASRDPKQTYKEYIKTKGSAAVCKGDSGGSSYTGTGPRREIQAVVSRGNMSTDSYLVNILDNQIANWIRGWSKEHKVKICGADADAKNCRP